MKWKWTKILFIAFSPFAAIALFFIIGHLVKGNIFKQFIFSDQVRVISTSNAEFAEFVDEPGLGFFRYKYRDFFAIRIWYRFLDETDYRLLHMSSFEEHYQNLTPTINEVSCMDATERYGYSYMAATPNIGIYRAPNSEETLYPPETAIYVVNPKERHFLIRIEVGFDKYGDITINHYGKCKLPRIDKNIHSLCKISTKSNVWQRRKQDREKFKEESLKYETRMMSDSLFLEGLREAFELFNLNTDCLDSLVRLYGKDKGN